MRCPARGFGGDAIKGLLHAVPVHRYVSWSVVVTPLPPNSTVCECITSYAIAVPRIGMEVIIQFERGNIDRPICTGMVYNGMNKPPYAMPGDMNKLGIRTNSTKGGGGFHELTFDDTKGSESVFFQSEKDYKEIIKNNAVITIGMEKKDEGNLTQTVYKNSTETIKTGDMKRRK